MRRASRDGGKRRPGVAALRWSLFLIACFLAYVAVMRLLFPLPSLGGRTPSAALTPDGSAALAAALQPQAARHPGVSGVMPLPGGVDAFAARMTLARAAERSIDAQYYIWQNDMTGLLLLDQLDAAARRGVRVRLLVDDNGTPDLDPELAALDGLPWAEVRIFNPFQLRNPRLLSYTFDFFRLNRRMHNKSFTVDGVTTIVGGRNIGDIYFETGSGSLYFDLDVLSTGPVVADVGADFDKYWNSGSAYPVSALIPMPADAAGRIGARAATFRGQPQAIAFRDAVMISTLVSRLRNGGLDFEWGPVKVISDDPAKGLGLARPDEQLTERLFSEIGEPQSRIDIVSAYFIPGPRGSDRMANWARRGIVVNTLTNALEATDVTPVHSGYIGYRDALVDGGVRVWELRSKGNERRTVNDFGVTGVSDASLHAKTLAVDGKRAFVGSFNFDPRSKRLNTEMGLLIDSHSIAQGMHDWMDKSVPGLAYRVSRGADGGLLWTAQDDTGATRTTDVEPNTSAPLRALVWLVGLLPIEWLL